MIYYIFVNFLVIGVILLRLDVGLLRFIVLRTVRYVICRVWLSFSWIVSVCGFIAYNILFFV